MGLCSNFHTVVECFVFFVCEKGEIVNLLIKIWFIPCTGSEGPDLLHSEVQVHVSHSEQPEAQYGLRVPDQGLHGGRIWHLRPQIRDNHQRRGHR